MASLSAPIGCLHEHFLEVIGKVSDCCTVTLKQQKDPEGLPIEKRPFTFSMWSQPNHDVDLAMRQGYCPRIVGVGSGDYIITRICIACKCVLEFPTRKVGEWKQALEERTNSEDEDEETEEDEVANNV